MLSIRLLGTTIAVGGLLLSSSAYAQSSFDNSENIISSLKSDFPNLSDADARTALSGEFRDEMAAIESCVSQLDGYAGMYIRYAPKLEAVTKFNKSPNKKLRQCTKDKLFKAVGAASSLEQLEEASSLVSDTLSDVDFPYGLETDIIKNRVTVEVFPENFKIAKNALKNIRIGNNPLSRIVKLRKGDGFIFSTTADDIIEVQGNIRAGDCTTGFNVKETNAFGVDTGRKGVSTAGHCDNSSFSVGGGFFSPNSQQYVDERWEDGSNPSTHNDQDVQWHTNANDIYENRVSYTNVVPGTFLAVEATIATSSLTTAHPFYLTTGSYLCRLGRVSNDEKCGFYKGFVNATDDETKQTLTIPAFEALSGPLSQRGDSGGPVYAIGNNGGILAAGVLSSGAGGIATFSPVDKFSNLNIRVITAANP